ncbi:hypothetical protein A3I94_01375 [Candidatus Giovannonibacteria bacterium RIFCSPLOWO2_02_FULL_43_54]|nr:MAG: hypothetical protein A3I94_01375 [Candidatus Giovannonibacteria bacterium RIFCSPLOWO2_02_FULL_43_54]
MEKRLVPFTKFESGNYGENRVRWTIVFRFWTIGLVKGGYIKKSKRIWYLTQKGQELIGLKPIELTKISSHEYAKWNENRRDSEEENTDSAEDISYPDAMEESIMPLGNMKIKPLPISFDELLNGVDKSAIQIPPFQRNFVWVPKMITDLLDSIYRGYPIGSFIFWKTNKRLPFHREIGGLKINESLPGSRIDYVLDGQQRITSLYAAVRGATIDDEKYNFYFDVSIGKFDYSKIDENADQGNDRSRIPLDKIFVEGPVYRQYIKQFPDKYQEILDDLFFRFKNYAFSVIYVQEDNEQENENNLKRIVSIFSRINDTGKKLTVVAKMIARCWGENFDLRSRLNQLLNDSEELSGIREETILQIASTILNNKKCKSRNILNDTDIDNLEENWDDIVEAFKQSLQFLRDKFRIKNINYIPFDSILVPLSYFHFHTHNPSKEQIEQLCKWFWKASLSNRYSSTLESRIEEGCMQFDKILDNKIAEFNYTLGWDTFRLRLIKQDYGFRSAFCKTILCLYSYNMPQNFKDNSLVDLSTSFSSYSKRHLHHVFPRGYLNRTNVAGKELQDSIVNISFMPAMINNEMSDDPPSKYLKFFSEKNNEIGAALRTHLIGNLKEFGIESNDFNKFLEKRAEKIENEFRALLGLRTKTERDFEENPSEPLDLFEIRLRDLFNDKLAAEYGENYWNEGIPQIVRDEAEKKIQKDLRSHPYNEEKYLDGRERLNFLDMSDYSLVIMQNWPLFKRIFMSRGEVERHFLALMKYRNPIKHTRGLNIVDKKNGEAAVLWFEQIFNSLTKN